MGAMDHLADLFGDVEQEHPADAKAREAQERDEVKVAFLDHVGRGGTAEGFDYPTRLLWRWRSEDPDFADDWDRARARGCDALAYQCLTIADAQGLAPVADRKLMIETRMKLISKWAPAVYGDAKVAAAEAANQATGRGKPLTDAELVPQILEILANAKARQLQDPNNRLN